MEWGPGYSGSGNQSPNVCYRKTALPNAVAKYQTYCFYSNQKESGQKNNPSKWLFHQIYRFTISNKIMSIMKKFQLLCFSTTWNCRMELSDFFFAWKPKLIMEKKKKHSAKGLNIAQMNNWEECHVFWWMPTATVYCASTLYEMVINGKSCKGKCILQSEDLGCNFKVWSNWFVFPGLWNKYEQWKVSGSVAEYTKYIVAVY